MIVLQSQLIVNDQSAEHATSSLCHIEVEIRTIEHSSMAVSGDRLKGYTHDLFRSLKSASIVTRHRGWMNGSSPSFGKETFNMQKWSCEVWSECYINNSTGIWNIQGESCGYLATVTLCFVLLTRAESYLSFFWLSRVIFTQLNRKPSWTH